MRNEAQDLYFMSLEPWVWNHKHKTLDKGNSSTFVKLKDFPGALHWQRPCLSHWTICSEVDAGIKRSNMKLIEFQEPSKLGVSTVMFQQLDVAFQVEHWHHWADFDAGLHGSLHGPPVKPVTMAMATPGPQRHPPHGHHMVTTCHTHTHKTKQRMPSQEYVHV